jgi:hypothetical protein
MIMTTSNLLLCSLLMSGALLALPVLADPPNSGLPTGNRQTMAVAAPPFPPPPPPPGLMPGFPPGCGQREFDYTQLALSDDQMERINALKTKAFDSTAAQSAELGSLVHRLEDMLSKLDADRDQIVSVQQKINALHSALATTWLNCRLDTLFVLTSEQKKQLRHQMLLQAISGPGRLPLPPRPRG